LTELAKKGKEGWKEGWREGWKEGQVFPGKGPEAGDGIEQGEGGGVDGR